MVQGADPDSDDCLLAMEVYLFTIFLSLIKITAIPETILLLAKVTSLLVNLQYILKIETMK